MPTLTTGARGKRVLELQARLRQLGYAEVAPDGIFGPTTESAVANIQHRHGLPADGRVDPRTRALIRSEHAIPLPAQSQADIDDGETDRHLVYLQRAVTAPDEAARRGILAEGFIEFGPRLLASAGRFVDYSESALADPDTPGDVRAGIASRHEGLETLRNADETFMDWLGGLSFSERLDEAESRARFGVVVLDEMGLAGLTRRAVRAVLALPDDHPDRRVDWARDAIVSHLHRSRAIGDPEEIVETISTIIASRLVDERQALRLLAEGARIATASLNARDQREFWATAAGYYLVQASAERERVEQAADAWLPGLAGRIESPNRRRLSVWRRRAERAFARMEALTRRLAPRDRRRVSMRNTFGLAALYGADQPRKSADMLRTVLDSGALDESTLRGAARLEAKLRLTLDEPRRVLKLLEPRVDTFEQRYLAALTDSDVDEAGEEYDEVVSALAFASAAVGRWDRAVHYLARPRGLRLRHRAALRRAPEGTTIVDLERRVHALSRGLQAGTDAPRRPREQDWVGAALREETVVLEQYRRHRFNAPIRLEHAHLRDISSRLHPREALVLFGVSHRGLLIAVVCPGDLTKPSGRFHLAEWPERRLVQALMGPELDGWVMALGGRVSPPLDPHEPLERILRDLEEPVGATLGAFARKHGLQHLTLMPDPWLDFVPLWALPGLTDVDVSIGSSVSQFLYERHSDPVVVRDVLVVSDPTRDLPASMAEGAVVNARLSGHGVKVVPLIREQATVGAVVQALARADAWHFSGHGRSVLSAPLESALELHPDWTRIPVKSPAGFLALVTRDDLAWQQPFAEVREATLPGTGHIRQLTDSDSGTFQAWLDYDAANTLWGLAAGGGWSRVSELWTAGNMMLQDAAPRTRVAFLSACSTGGAFTPSAAGASGLVAALQLVGVAAVVSARWPVNDALTALFVDLFYETLERLGATATLTHGLRETAAAFRAMTRETAIARLAVIRDATADLRASLALSVFSKALEAAADHPFHHPHDWAAFHVAGEGTLRIVLPDRNGAHAPISQ